MSIQVLLGFIRKELIQSLRDPRIRFFLFVVPVVQMTLFGVAISTEVKNIRLAVIGGTTDFLLNDIEAGSYASGSFISSKTSHAGGDPYLLIESGQPDAVLVAPAGGFTQSVQRGQGQLQLLINATNVTQAQSVEIYLKKIISNVVEKEHGVGSGSQIQIDQRVLFNPDLNTALFMIPATMAMLMLISTMILSNLALVREKELGTFEMLISAPVSRAEVIFGKTLPYVILGMSNFPLILGVAMGPFHVPLRGSLLVLLMASFCFVCTSVALGSLISTYCRSQQQATLAAFLFLFPMIMFSGLMFPIENIPESIRWMSYIDPLAHFMGLLRNIMLKGGGGVYVLTHISILAFMAVITIYGSYRRFKTTLD